MCQNKMKVEIPTLKYPDVQRTLKVYDDLAKELSGVKFDKDKMRLDLVPVEAVHGMAKVLTFGAKKYSARNWEKGIKYSRVYGALLRHITAWWLGEDEDEETGLSHLHHASCCIAFLQTFTERGMVDLDDRP